MSAGKVVASFAEAVADIDDGATLIVGGFGLCGIPEKAIAALREKGSRELVVVSNNCGVDDFGLGILLANRQIAKMVVLLRRREQDLRARSSCRASWRSSWSRRARSPSGCAPPGRGSRPSTPPTGVGTPIAEGKEIREFDGRTYLLERALGGDFALVKAWRGDPLGNLVYRDTARNFNPLAAMAGRVTIAEVEELVEVGRARSQPDPHAGHLRAADPRGIGLREADRAAHREGALRWPLASCATTRARGSSRAPPRELARRHERQPRDRAADAARRPRRGPARRAAAVRERAARHRALPARGRGGPRSDQRRQGDGHRGRRAPRSSTAPSPSR